MRKTVLVLAALVLLTALSGCTGGESIEVSSEWEIVMEGLAFNRGTIAVPAGEEVALRLQNADNYTHHFAVYRQEGDEQAIVGPIEVPAHTIKEFVFTSPKETGRYHYRDDGFPQKMTGVLIVSDENEVSLD